MSQQVPEVDEHEVEQQWRSIANFYEREMTLGPSCLAKGLISFNEIFGVDHPGFDDYSDDEFVALYMQVLLTRPELELSALGYLLVELIGEERFTREAEPDLDRLVAKLHEVGGFAGLRQIWVDRGGPQSRVIGSADSVSRRMV